MKSFILATLGLMASAFPVCATVTINVGATGIMRDSAGSPIVTGAIGLLVADTDGNNLANPFGTTLSLTPGNTLGNAGSDLILGLYQAEDVSIDNSGKIGFDLSSTIFTYSGSFGPGDALYLVWFPTITTLGSVVGAGISYGVFRTDSIDVLGTMAWTAPADGNYSLFSLDSSLGGNPAVSQAAFTASQITAVPEPSTYALLGVGVLGAALMRKKRRVC